MYNGDENSLMTVSTCHTPCKISGNGRTQTSYTTCSEELSQSLSFAARWRMATFQPDQKPVPAPSRMTLKDQSSNQQEKQHGLR